MPHAGIVDLTPLSPAQVRVLVAGAGRELCWGLRAVSRETRAWRELAMSIPNAALRDDALRSLDHKRGHADGAALFTILPRRRHSALLRLLVAYETIVDFLDNVSERHPTKANGQQLHRALLDALDPDRPLSDYYRFHPWHDDGGYLVALVNVCREGCLELPSFDRVRSTIARETRRALVLGVNHEPDPALRDAELRAWAAIEFPGERELSWFELSGAASATLVVLVLLTLATDPALSDRVVNDVYMAYWPWVALATTMLDSYVDQEDDQSSGDHSYIAHYPDPEAARRRLRQSIIESLTAVRGLADDRRHALIVGCMVAMYLSKDSARSSAQRATTSSLVDAGGSLVRLLLPILRLWRLAYAQRAA
jgi:tetraprenyl-beta-curcumene synthase